VLRPCERLVRAGEAGALPSPLPLPLVLVVDALDECKAPAEIELVLELLSELSGLAATPLRILLTSRPEITVRAGLDSMSERQRRHVILHHVEPSVVNHDLDVFFEHMLAALIRSRPLLPELTDKEVLQRLVERADGLFIWAATAYCFIKEGGAHARSRLDVIVKRRISGVVTSQERKLDDIYISVLRSAIQEQWTTDEKERFCRLLNDVLGTVAVLFSSLPVAALAAHARTKTDQLRRVLCMRSTVMTLFGLPRQPISRFTILQSDENCLHAALAAGSWPAFRNGCLTAAYVLSSSA
jgi:hypothetical protein